MKNNSKSIKIVVFTLALLVLPFATQVVMGQVPPPGPPVPPPGVPIDGGITLLLAGLGAYGAKKVFGKKEEE